ncbi:Rrf2 family transcriptional regulator [bacterium]|nr:Rrf2 family transcriptional regulator [bacterium]
MFFSKSWNYALRALIYLAEHRDDGQILSSVIAEEEAIPGPFLVKIMGKLATANIVDSTRGRNGGFRLKRKPKQIKLVDITRIFDSFESYGNCLLGYGDCVRDDSCPIHKYWAEPERLINEFLENTTIEMLCKPIPADERKALINERVLSAKHKPKRIKR